MPKREKAVRVAKPVKVWACVPSRERAQASWDRWLSCRGMGIGGEDAPRSCAKRMLLVDPKHYAVTPKPTPKPPARKKQPRGEGGRC